MTYNCPEPYRYQGRSGSGFEQIGVSIVKKYHEGLIETNWIIIDTLYTASVWNNKRMLQGTK